MRITGVSGDLRRDQGDRLILKPLRTGPSHVSRVGTSGSISNFMRPAQPRGDSPLEPAQSFHLPAGWFPSLRPNAQRAGPQWRENG